MNIAPNHIRVWKFHEAPEELQQLSTNGGDEDWLALIPPSLAGTYISWIATAGFGACDVSTYNHPELPGYEVRIGQHA